MTSSQTVTKLLPTLLRIAHKPGGLLLMAAAGATGLLTLMSLAVIASSSSPIRFLPLALAIVLWIFIAAFGIYREILRRNLDDLERQATGVAVVIDDDVVSHDQEVAPHQSSGAVNSALHDEAQALGEAYRETTIRTAKYFPRIEAAQRGLIRAAGGVVNAPYLKHDLRIIIGSFIGTAAALPLALFGFTVCAFALLLS
ncbi:hypothetical protein [Bowdeniella massiliensis]|uniref:hypothetical protein n=1 Tax=Bowdeniella massiliensis TaxID=2932264 RepID=UPI0020278D06|nr:hypothetical protein [Bowdeniella massiliensis]